jgi:hypothetical protein
MDVTRDTELGRPIRQAPKPTSQTVETPSSALFVSSVAQQGEPCCYIIVGLAIVKRSCGFTSWLQERF